MAETKPGRHALVAVDPPKRGRPRSAEPGSTVSVWLPASAHDRIIEIAKHEEQSISATVKQLLILRLD